MRAMIRCRSLTGMAGKSFLRTRLSTTILYKTISMGGFQEILECLSRTTTPRVDRRDVLEVLSDRQCDSLVDVFGHGLISIDDASFQGFLDSRFQVDSSSVGFNTHKFIITF